jgi:uncharacterized protein (TIGR02246 family)
MRHILILLLCTAPAFAQNSVEAVIAAVNEAAASGDAQAFATLFAADGDLWRGGKRVASGREAIAHSFKPRGVWTEQSPPKIKNESVRIVTPDVALVDAIQVRYGAMNMGQTVPVLMLLRRMDDAWKIVTMRVMGSDGVIIRPAS